MDYFDDDADHYDRPLNGQNGAGSQMTDAQRQEQS